MILLILSRENQQLTFPNNHRLAICLSLNQGSKSEAVNHQKNLMSTNQGKITTSQRRINTVSNLKQKSLSNINMPTSKVNHVQNPQSNQLPNTQKRLPKMSKSKKQNI